MDRLLRAVAFIGAFALASALIGLAQWRLAWRMKRTPKANDE